MARDVTVTFSDGTNHVYQNAPDDITPEAVQARAEKEFGKTVTHLDGGKGKSSKDYQRQPVGDIFGGTAEALMNLTTGTAGQLLVGPGRFYYGLATGESPREAAKAQERAAAAVTYQPRTQAGQAIAEYNPLALAGRAIAYGGGKVGDIAQQTATDLGAPLPVAATIGGVTDVGTQLGAQYLGAKAAPTIVKGAVKVGKDTVSALTPTPAPTRAELKTAATAAYTRAKESGATFDLKSVAPDLQKQIVDEGFNPRLHPKLNDIMGELADLSSASIKGTPASTTQVNNFYKILNKALKGTEDERRIAGLIADNFDAAIYAINPQVAADLIQGRDLWARMSKSRQIESVVKRAKLSQQQTSEAIKKGFAKLKTAGYTPEELAVVKTLSEGTPVINTLSLLGKLAPTGNLTGATRALLLEQAAQHAFISPATAVALGVGGAAARGGANALAVAKANELAASIRRGATLEPYRNFNFANPEQTNALRPQ